MADNPIGNLVVRLDFDGTAFERGITAAKRELHGYGNAMRTSITAAKDHGYAMDYSNKALNNMQVTYQGLNARVGQLQGLMTKEEAQNGRNTAVWSRYSNELNKHKSEMYALSQEYDAFQKQAMIANNPFTKMSEGMMATGNHLRNLGQGFTEAGQTIGMMAGAVTAGGALFVKQAIDFESGMIAVQKTTNATSSEMGIFERDIKRLAGTMPIAISELQALASIAGQLGVPQSELSDFTEVMAMMGTATSLSAEQAAEAFARFTNITGTGTTTLRSLGSAVVDLGNNFATTETEIMNLATMLVGTLNTVGVSEPQILGLSAAMSALGITAERGGSSMSKFFVDMSSAVSEGEESLASLAEVARMSSDEFATLFQEDAMGAFTAFIDGLAMTAAEGGDVLKILEDLGINEIRLRDTILRLANGHEVLHSALDKSNEAYAKANALQEEYDLLAASTAAQVQVAKNQFSLLAIQVGQALLPAILDLLNSGDGLLQFLQGAADWFTGLDDSVKRNIVTWSALSVALAPVLMGIGSFLNLGGNVFRIVAGISGGIGKLGGSIMAAFAPDITGKVATFASGMAKLGLIQFGTIAGGIALVYGAYRLLNDDAIKANQAMADFPSITDITHAQAEALRAVQTEVMELGVQLNTLDTDTDLTAVNDNVGTLAEAVKKVNNERIESLRESLARLPESVRESLEAGVEATIANMEAQVARADEIVARIQKITDVGFDDSGVLRPEYVLEYKTLTDELIHYYAISLAETAEQYAEFQSYLTGSVTNMTRNQLAEREKFIAQSIQQEVELYEEQKNDILHIAQETGAGKELVNENLEKVERAHIARMTALQEEYIRTIAAKFDTLTEDEQMRMFGTTNYEEYLRGLADTFGMTFEEIQSIINRVDFDMPVDKLITAFDKLDSKSKETASKWNTTMNTFAESLEDGLGKPLSEVTFDDIHENIDMFIQKAHEAGLAWEDLSELSTSPEIDDTNLKELMALMAQAMDSWKYMEFEDKVAKVTVEGEEALKNITEAYGVEWSSVEDHWITAGVKFEGAEQIAAALYNAGLWEQMDLEDKKAIITALFNNDELTSNPMFEEIWNSDDKMTQLLLDIFWGGEDAAEKVHALLVEWGILEESDTVELNTNTNAEETEAELGAVRDTHQFLGGLGVAHLRTSTNGETTINVLQRVGTTLSGLNGRVATVTVRVAGNAGLSLERISSQLTALNGRTATTYTQTIARGSVGRGLYSGTNYHTGGWAILGDGGKREPFMTPDGRFGVSPDHDTMYDLPIGSKVWSSISQFQREARNNGMLHQLLDYLPKYADGTNKSFLDSMSKISIPDSVMQGIANNMTQPIIIQNGDEEALNVVIGLLQQLLRKDSGFYVDSRDLSRSIEKPLQNRTRRSDKQRQRMGGLHR